MAKLVDGTAGDATAFERSVIDLVRKSVEAPRHLRPEDLEPLRAVAGDAALEYVHVLASFHFVNRIADLLHVDSEALPYALRGFARVRRIGVHIVSLLLRRMDLRNRRFALDFEATCERFAASAPELDRTAIATLLAPLAARPQVAEGLRLGREELATDSSLPPSVLARVLAAVEDALPGSPDEAHGFHPRPSDPLDALAFVGTRYPQRTTEDMVRRLRDAGYSDLGILDLAIAVAEANGWARMRRLLGLDPTLLSAHVPGSSASPVASVSAAATS